MLTSSAGIFLSLREWGRGRKFRRWWKLFVCVTSDLWEETVEEIVWRIFKTTSTRLLFYKLSILLLKKYPIENDEIHYSRRTYPSNSVKYWTTRFVWPSPPPLPLQEAPRVGHLNFETKHLQREITFSPRVQLCDLFHNFFQPFSPSSIFKWNNNNNNIMIRFRGGETALADEKKALSFVCRERREKERTKREM